MPSDEYESPADLQAEYCEREHSYGRDHECASCDQRAELQHCATCGASFEDGRWFTGIGSTTPNGCDHEALLDDWDNEVTCQTVRCGDPVTTAGRDRCDHHQRILDAEECGRVYQRLVATRRAA